MGTCWRTPEGQNQMHHLSEPTQKLINPQPYDLRSTNPGNDPGSYQMIMAPHTSYIRQTSSKDYSVNDIRSTNPLGQGSESTIRQSNRGDYLGGLPQPEPLPNDYNPEDRGQQDSPKIYSYRDSLTLNPRPNHDNRVPLYQAQKPLPVVMEVSQEYYQSSIQGRSHTLSARDSHLLHNRQSGRSSFAIAANRNVL